MGAPEHSGRLWLTHSTTRTLPRRSPQRTASANTSTAAAGQAPPERASRRFRELSRRHP